MGDTDQKQLLRNERESSNGNDCFFSESTFLRVMGPGPSLEERLHSLSSRPKTQELKKKIKVQIDRSIFNSSLKVEDEKSQKIFSQRIDVGTSNESLSGNPSVKRQTVSKGNETLGNVELNSKSDKDSSSIDEIINKKTYSEIVNDTTTKQDDVSETNLAHVERKVIIGNTISSEGDRMSPCKPSLPIANHENRSKGEESSETMSEARNIISQKEDLPDTPNEMLSPGRDEEELCCLVLPNSSDDDSDDEDVTQLNGTEKSSLLISSIEKNTNVEAKSAEGSKEEAEESFCLVMPNISSDEQSSKEDSSNPYKLYTLNSPQEKQISVQISSKTQASEIKELRNYATKSESQPNSQSLIKFEPVSITNESVAKTEGNPPISIFALNENNSMETEKMGMSCNVNNTGGCFSGAVKDQSVVAGPSNLNKNPETSKIFRDERSKLSKKQHKRYIQLYKRYVCPMMKGNGKNKYTEAEMRDLVELEEIQQLVSQEQVVYQEYLKQKALRRPNAYNFLQNVSRIYSHTRYNSYHRPRNYVRNFEVDGFMNIPLVLEDKNASAIMNFKKTVLKLGHSAKVTLPNVKDGANPVPIKVEARAINDWFPSSNRDVKTNNCVDHKMISVDSNAMKLAEQEGVDIVMSSSSMKCLMDNHASDIMRAWDIPVTIKSNDSAKQGSKTVYLDKPLYRDDFLIRDYNALYHKYALRTFVSQPRGPGVRTRHSDKMGLGEQPHKNTPVRRESLFDAGNFDMFSTDTVCDIETFGSYTNKRTRSSSMNYSDALADETGHKNDGEPVKTTELIGRLNRSKRKSEDRTIMKKESLTSTESPISPPSSVHSLLSSTKPSECLGTKSSSSEVKKDDTQSLRRTTRSSSSYNSLQSNREDNQTFSLDPEHTAEGPPAKVVKTDRDRVTTAPAVPELPKRKRGRPKMDQSLTESNVFSAKTEIIMETESPASPTVETESPASPTVETESPASPTVETESPASPTMETESPASPTVESESPASPTMETESPASPTVETESPASPTMELESPASPMIELESPASPTPMLVNDEKVVEVPLSPVKRDSVPWSDQPSTSALDSRPSTNVLDSQTSTGVLDSILGPTETEDRERLNRLRESIEFQGKGWEEMLPVEEKCSCIVYSVWELGAMKILLRCNRHGTLKDQKKARYVYLSSKMEYQPDSGMEQVTLSEMTRDWTSCFIRPGTNLVRARINAFNSEIVMLEELSAERILNPSLPFKPVHSFEVLRRILVELKSLPDGHYLLNHQKGNKFCRVRKFHGKGSLMAAPKKKKSGRAKEGHVPWIPIDPTILTPSHIYNARIPATFMPSDWEPTVKKNFQGDGYSNPNQEQRAGWKGRGGHNNPNQEQRAGWKGRGGHNNPNQEQRAGWKGRGGHNNPNQEQSAGWKGQNRKNQGKWNKHKGGN